MYRAALSAAILISSAFLLYLSSLRIIAQYQYSQGAALVRNEQYESALTRFKKAIEFQTGEARNWKALGKAYYLLGGAIPFPKTYNVAIKAKDAYMTASRLKPIDAEIFFGLATVEQLLERLYPFFHSGQNPHNPLPYIHQAISLYPKNLIYHFLLADYYYNKRDLEALAKTAFHVASLSPESYAYLKKEPYWNISTVKDAFQQGLLQTIQDKQNAISAHTVVGSILESEKDWKGALFHYETLPVPEEKRKAAQHYFHLGRLCEYAANSGSNSEYFSKAAQYYQKAVTLDRSNHLYQKHYENITQKLRVTQ